MAMKIYLSTIDPLPFWAAWSIAIGLAQVKMNWLYDWSEVKERFKTRTKTNG
jgi:hypothetical protein